MDKNNWVVESANGGENLDFINMSKKEAKKYEWLYHCTNADVAKSIISNKQFWLSSLELVNDKEEYARVKAEGYENNYYVLCFSYDESMNDDDWKEYGDNTQSVQIGIKQNWLKEIESVNFVINNKIIADNHYEILKNRNDMSKFYLETKDTYKVIYDDDLYKKIIEDGLDSLGNEINFVTPEIGGIIKKKQGSCQRIGEKPYLKNWESEKEVRFKVQLHNELYIQKGIVVSNRIAITLNDSTFKEIKLRFHPKFKNKNEFLEDIYKLIPKENVEVLN